LKEAFERARTDDNIDVIVDPLLASELFVLAMEFPGFAKPQFYALPSPMVPNRICVTAAEPRDPLAGIADVVLIKMTGRELLETLEPFPRVDGALRDRRRVSEPRAA
jgi:hypothetical protein